MTGIDLQRKKVAHVVLTLCLLLHLAQMTPLFAWGEKGHLLVVKLASSRLSPATTRAIDEILGGKSLDSVAMWADRIKPERPETAPFHFISFPKPATDDSENFPVTETNILTAIDHFSQVMRDQRAPANERQEALKFLIHLVGDLHQPLHCAPAGDAGGNSVSVVYFGKPSNLHKVWDVGLIESTGLSIDQYYAGLTAEFGDSDSQPGPPLNPAEWAKESNEAAVSQAYLLPDDHKLSERYYEANIRTVNRQLYKAGCRLSDLLNSILEQPGLNCPLPIAKGHVKPVVSHFLPIL